MNRVSYSRFRNSWLRSACGQAIAEGAVSIVLVVIAMFATVLLLLDVGLTNLYKMELAFAAEQAAEYGASLPANSNVTGLTTAKAYQLVKNMRLPMSGPPAIALDPPPSQQQVTVTISGTFSILPGVQFNLPLNVKLADTAQSLIPSSSSGLSGLLWSPAGGVSIGRIVYVPVSWTTTLPDDGLIY